MGRISSAVYLDDYRYGVAAPAVFEPFETPDDLANIDCVICLGMDAKTELFAEELERLRDACDGYKERVARIGLSIFRFGPSS